MDRAFYYVPQKSKKHGFESFRIIDEKEHTYASLIVSHSPKIPDRIVGSVEGSSSAEFRVIRGKTRFVGFTDRIEFDGRLVGHIDGRGFGKAIPYLIDHDDLEPFPFFNTQSNYHEIEFGGKNGLELTLSNSSQANFKCEVEIKAASGILESNPWLMPIVVCFFHKHAMLD